MTSQTAFRAALLDAAEPVPEGLTDGAGQPAGRRYAVYRNNVAVSLREALGTGFPAVKTLIGVENFDKVAGLYLRAAPPASPLMMQYGAGFPAFLESFAPLSHIGYLADVARLELALRQSYHAADATPAEPAILARLDEPALMATRMDLVPALRILRSPWPVVSVYRYAMTDGAPKPPAVAENAIVLRPDYDPEPHVLPRGGAEFVGALARGDRFGEAIAAAGEDFDLAATLNLLLANGALSQITPGET